MLKTFILKIHLTCFTLALTANIYIYSIIKIITYGFCYLYIQTLPQAFKKILDHQELWTHLLYNYYIINSNKIYSWE